MTFPGLGEKFASKEKIRKGTLVTTDDGNFVRPAKPGEAFFGVVRGEIGISPGGGDVTNSRYLHDEFGDRIFEDVEIQSEVPDPDWKPSEGQSQKDRPKIQKSEWVRAPVANPDHDPEKEVIILDIEFIGRCFVRVDDDVEVGDYLEPGEDGIATASEEVNGWRVFTLNNNVAFVMANLFGVQAVTDAEKERTKERRVRRRKSQGNQSRF